VSENANLVKYYADLSIIQYANKPKARAFMENLLGALICYDLAVSVRDGFNLETAVGAQLDIIAKYVGVSRVITGTSFSRSYFGFAEYGDTTPFVFYGFTKYGDAPEDVQYRNYKESSQSIYSLNDTELRIIIKLAILRNNSNASVKDIDTLLDALFGSEVYYIDRMNMTVVSYMLSTAYQRIFNIAKSSGLLPNPAAVGTSLIVVPNINKIFSYSLYGGAKPSFAIGYVDYFPEWSKGNTWLQLTSIGLFSTMARLSDSRFVINDTGTGSLQVYDFDGANITQFGNSFYIGYESYSMLASLSETRIALYNVETSLLQAYDFNGTDWAAVGNGLNIGAFSGAMAGLSSSRIVIGKYSARTLQAYDFDGTDWTATGSSYYTGLEIAMVSFMTSTRIAILGSNILQAYDFDGSSWTPSGANYTLSTTGFFSMFDLTSLRIAYIDHDGNLQAYDFDGTDWTSYASIYSISDISGYFFTINLTSSEIALVNIVTKKIEIYDFTRDLSGCMASYS
jgi:hypothetical protein